MHIQNKKITIIGLGIIGGSYAKGLSQKGYTVYGVDKSQEVIEYAIDNKFISAGSLDPADFVPHSDIVVIGLYPEAIIPYLKEHKHLFNNHQVVTDVCGVKQSICQNATLILENAYFVGSHPMAGREKVGIKYADETIFKGANFLICPIEGTSSKALDIVKELASDLEFGAIYEISPAFHDEMIAYTSQLTHAMAVSLVNSQTNQEAFKFVGDSYRDLTRIAMINEKLWSQLFLENKHALIDQIDLFVDELLAIKKAIENDDSQLLKEKFISSKKKREVM